MNSTRFLKIHYGFSALLLWALGYLSPIRLPDTGSYLTFGTSLSSALESLRTPIYPFLLHLISAFDQSFTILPFLQLAFYFAAVHVLYRALRFCGLTDRAAMLGCIPLLWSSFLFRYVKAVLPDICAAALLILTLAHLLVFLHSGTPRSLFFLSGSITLAYLTKPLYLFLIPSVMLVAVAARPWQTGTRENVRLLSRLGISIFTPFLCYCSLRYFIMGHFGVASYGGYSLSGISAQLLTKDSSAHLNGRNHLLGEKILERRHELAAVNPCPNYCSFDYSRRAFPDNYFPGGCFNHYAWEIAIPAAKEMSSYESEVNDVLTSFSFQVIKLHWINYLQWLVASIVYGISRLFIWNFSFVALTLGTLALLAIASMYTINERMPAAMTSSENKRAAAQLHISSLMLFFIGLFVIVLVQPPIPRYVQALSLPLHSSLSVAAATLWSRIFSPR